MLCERCQKRQATIQLKQTINGQVRSHHLCADCARETGVSVYKPFADHFSQGSFLGETLFDHPAGSFAVRGRPAQQNVQTCAACGQTMADFKRIGRFGCPDCYTAFREPVAALLNQIHGSARHVSEDAAGAAKGDNGPETGTAAKTDSSETSVSAQEKQIRALKADLKQAVTVEDYERAAILRDRIRELEVTGKAGQADE